MRAVEVRETPIARQVERVLLGDNSVARDIVERFRPSVSNVGRHMLADPAAEIGLKTVIRGLSPVRELLEPALMIETEKFGLHKESGVDQRSGLVADVGESVDGRHARIERLR